MTTFDGVEVDLREVGPRDGLQAEAPIEPAHRVRLLEAVLAAGLRHVEVASFVSPTAVPAMAGAEAVVAGLGPRPGVVRAALVPNRRGAERALAAGVDELTVTVSASPTYGQRNVAMTIEQSLAAVAEVVALASGAVPVDAVVSFCFGSPYEEVGPDDVALLCQRLRAAGVDALTLADTTGMGTPRRLADVLGVVGADVGLHLHETRGTGLVNVYAGLELGVRRFDCAVGGLGGSPFAPGAGGNVATEAVVALLDDLGVRTGVDVEAVIAAALVAEELVGHPVPSPVARAGPRTRRPSA